MLGVPVTQDHLQKHFGLGFEEVKQHLSSKMRQAKFCHFCLIQIALCVPFSQKEQEVIGWQQSSQCVGLQVVCYRAFGDSCFGVHTSQGRDSHQHWYTEAFILLLLQRSRTSTAKLKTMPEILLLFFFQKILFVSFKRERKPSSYHYFLKL